MVQPRCISTPFPSVLKLLDLCALSPGDVLADLGSGDGRIPILGACIFDASRTFGIESDPSLVKGSQELVREVGIDDRVEFVCGDLFSAILNRFDVITIFQSQQVIEELIPKLGRELRAGTRIISYLLPLGSYSPLRLLKPWRIVRPFYLYRAPLVPLGAVESLSLVREMSKHADESEAEWSRVWTG